ncbi:DNA repair protein RadA [Candidatus Uhrbacteria bacterium RIFCSPHIGHO2_02_FULL_57_19]|uniref:DNA repair protein RadA n=1 Tax=Candidatus Uhrbacteria bacterium RIFCSPHIGHO2_02_FULL_57_19 TaxID=1802391 RepID=A0A1F7U873_9BACT|nr:MAG: DNA repair protein RadA [Candidatus Uhrbacteria bacterium RIFCSPHIGHO2_02_FULL_57_19]
MPLAIPYVCAKCDAQYPKWVGRCSECGGWGTVAEGRISGQETQKSRATPGKTVAFDQVAGVDAKRSPTGIGEVDRVLGGGVVRGSLILLAGEPGIGKSTLVLQIAEKLGGPILYVAGEESPSQIKLRAERLGVSGSGLKFLPETDIDTVAATVAAERPTLTVVDSIQTMRVPDGGEPGGPGGIRAATSRLAELAKREGTTTLVIGQVTKDGGIAGPKTLEHLVDVVLTIEGDEHRAFRILRSAKNRFGGTDEVGVFRMGPSGLEEVINPSEAFLAERSGSAVGSVVTATVQGSRPILVEVQALTSRAAFGTPVRRANGFDGNRLLMLSAVLEKHGGVSLGNLDLYVNVVGGLTIDEPAADLAVAAAISSTAKGVPIDRATVVFGEIGLGGEIRSVPHLDRRLAEATKLGFSRSVTPASAKSVAEALAIL